MKIILLVLVGFGSFASAIQPIEGLESCADALNNLTADRLQNEFADRTRRIFQKDAIPVSDDVMRAIAQHAYILASHNRPLNSEKIDSAIERAIAIRALGPYENETKIENQTDDALLVDCIKRTSYNFQLYSIPASEKVVREIAEAAYKSLNRRGIVTFKTIDKAVERATALRVANAP